MEDGIVEFKIKKLESDVLMHNRRLSDHDALHSEARKDINMLMDLLAETKKQTGVLLELAPAIKNLESYVGKISDVFEPLAKILSFWAKLAVVFTFVWHSAKLLLAKIWAVNL